MKAKTISLIAILLVACQLSARDYSYPALEVPIWLQADGYHGYLPWIVMHNASQKSYGDVISKVITTISSATAAGGGGSMGGRKGAVPCGGGDR